MENVHAYLSYLEKGRVRRDGPVRLRGVSGDVLIMLCWEVGIWGTLGLRKRRGVSGRACARSDGHMARLQQNPAIKGHWQDEGRMRSRMVAGMGACARAVVSTAYHRLSRVCTRACGAVTCLAHVIGVPDLGARMRAILSGLVHVKNLRSGGGGTAQIAVTVWRRTSDRGRVRDVHEHGHRSLLRLRMRGANTVEGRMRSRMVAGTGACARAIVSATHHRLSRICARACGAVTCLAHVRGVPDLGARARAILSGLVHVKNLRGGRSGTAQIAVTAWRRTSDRGRVRNVREHGHRILLRLRMRGANTVVSGGGFSRV